MIGKALAVCRADRSDAPFLIRPAESDAAIVTEVELRDVTVQMLLGAMLIDAVHSTLEDGEVAFRRVRVNVRPDFAARHAASAHVFLLAAIDRLVAVGQNAPAVIEPALFRRYACDSR